MSKLSQYLYRTRRSDFKPEKKLTPAQKEINAMGKTLSRAERLVEYMQRHIKQQEKA